MKRRVNVVKMVLDVLMVLFLIIAIFFSFLFAINPTIIGAYIIICDIIAMIIVYSIFRLIGKACLRRYKQKMILNNIRHTEYDINLDKLIKIIEKYQV